VTPSTGIELSVAHLKWYNIRRTETEVPAELEEASRTFLRKGVAVGRLPLAGELGFVMLHRADGRLGPDSLAILFATVWRHANELWRAIYTKDLVDGATYELLTSDAWGPGYCVWELGAVWHERQPWNHFLLSDRDEQAIQTYLGDQFEGIV
jgi:hypothetical protein